MRVVMVGTVPTGIFNGGALGETIGLGAAVLFAAIGELSVSSLLLSLVRATREKPRSSTLASEVHTGSVLPQKSHLGTHTRVNTPVRTREEASLML